MAAVFDKEPVLQPELVQLLVQLNGGTARAINKKRNDFMVVPPSVLKKTVWRETRQAVFS